MVNVTAVISMLHESPRRNSATRYFRQQPVLAWTMHRLTMSKLLGSMSVLCWEDQLAEVSELAEDSSSCVLAKGPRIHVPSIDSVAAARRWADGWRGGLLYTCDFDLGFYGPWISEIVQKLGSDAIILVDPSAGLVDPKFIDKLIDHARAHPQAEFCFSQSAPGLGGTLLRPALLDRLAANKTNPGRLLYYLPDQPMRDPISGDGCVPIPTEVARTTRSFRLDSDRQVIRMTEASVHLNGELVETDSQDLVNRLCWTSEVDALPREVVLELTPRRFTSPIFSPVRFAHIERADLSLDVAKNIFEQIATAEDMRLTLAGVGDPLLHEHVIEIIEIARTSGISAIHVETDLLPDDPELISRLVDSEVDVVSVHVPAVTAQTYGSIMGADRYAQVIENVRRFIVRRHERTRGVPILTPLFTKCQLNLAEMESWYDQWLKALGAAVICGPSEFGGLVPDCGVADMSPPRRQACGRIRSRMTILSDGRAVSCEQDVMGHQVIGDAKSQPIHEIWRNGMAPLRGAHRAGNCDALPVCANCRQWNR